MTKAVELPQEAAMPDALAESIKRSMIEVHNLRAENGALGAEVERLERANLILESEFASLKLQLEQERAERRHYHSLANEIITRLDVVQGTIEDVVKRAEQETYRQRRENPRADVPPLKIPGFLERGPNGDASAAEGQ